MFAMKGLPRSVSKSRLTMRPLADGPDLTHTRPAAPPMPLHNAAWHDAQYNNRARVAEHAKYLSKWPAESAQARARLAGQLDLAYGDMPGERLDVFEATKAGAPIMVFIHGGYWRSLAKMRSCGKSCRFTLCWLAAIR